LSPGGSSTVHIYTQTTHATTQITTNLEECGPCLVFASDGWWWWWWWWWWWMKMERFWLNIHNF